MAADCHALSACLPKKVKTARRGLTLTRRACHGLNPPPRGSFHDFKLDPTQSMAGFRHLVPDSVSRAVVTLCATRSFQIWQTTPFDVPPPQGLRGDSNIAKPHRKAPDQDPTKQRLRASLQPKAPLLGHVLRKTHQNFHQLRTCPNSARRGTPSGQVQNLPAIFPRP
jgi:hypothetical protein